MLVLAADFAGTAIMLMLSIIRHHERLTVKLKGRLEGSSAEELRLAACPASALDIDLTGVTSIDYEGEQTLLWLRDRGATLHGERLFACKSCQRTQPSPGVQQEVGTTE